MADVWRNIYSEGECQTDNKVRSVPVRFDVSKILVTPHTATQVKHLKGMCAGVSDFAIGKASDLSKQTVATCKYLGVKGLFAAKPVPDCPKGNCLFSSVYKHDTNFLYVSKPQPSFAQMMRVPLVAESVHELDSVKTCTVVTSATSTASLPTAIGTFLTLATVGLLLW
jgi:hypothetical protein